MSWDAEIDFLAGPRPRAKQGRRAGRSEAQSPRDSEDAPPVVRGGWGEEGKKIASKQSSSTNLVDQHELIKEGDDADDIPIIPDIDDIQDDSALQEIKPPKSSITNNIYKELETELSNATPLLQRHDSKSSEIETQLADLYQAIMGPFKNIDEDDEREWTLEYLFEKYIKGADSDCKN